MNLSRNLIIALLGLGFYARSNNINLANNTTVLLIILALLTKNNNTDNGTEFATSRNTACPCNDTYATRVVYTEPYNVAHYSANCYTTPRNSCHYITPVAHYQNTPSYCTPCTPIGIWNTPRSSNHYTHPCHNILY